MECHQGQMQLVQKSEQQQFQALVRLNLLTELQSNRCANQRELLAKPVLNKALVVVINKVWSIAPERDNRRLRARLSSVLNLKATAAVRNRVSTLSNLGEKLVELGSLDW